MKKISKGHWSFKQSAIKKFPDITLKDLPGKVIDSVYSDTIEQAFGINPVIWLVFTDQTRCGFVLPTDME
jgi:hypothetical protein